MIKQRNEELQSLNEKNEHLKSLVDASIKANTKLITALNEVSEAMKALNKLLQRFTEENAYLHLSPAHAIYKVLVTISKTTDAVSDDNKAHHKYVKTMSQARRW